MKTKINIENFRKSLIAHFGVNELCVYLDFKAYTKSKYTSYFWNMQKNKGIPKSPSAWYIERECPVLSFKEIGKKIGIREIEAIDYYKSGMDKIKKICVERDISFSDFML